MGIGFSFRVFCLRVGYIYTYTCIEFKYHGGEREQVSNTEKGIKSQICVVLFFKSQERYLILGSFLSIKYWYFKSNFLVNL